MVVHTVSVKRTPAYAYAPIQVSLEQEELNRRWGAEGVEPSVLRSLSLAPAAVARKAERIIRRRRASSGRGRGRR